MTFWSCVRVRWNIRLFLLNCVAVVFGGSLRLPSMSSGVRFGQSYCDSRVHTKPSVHASAIRVASFVVLLRASRLSSGACVSVRVPLRGARRLCFAGRSVRRLLCQRLQACVWNQGLWRHDSRPRWHYGPLRLPGAHGCLRLGLLRLLHSVNLPVNCFRLP